MKWLNCLIAPDVTILDTVRRLDEVSGRTLLVVDQRRKLLGTVTDGDIRRGLLGGHRLEDGVSQVMNPTPKIANNEDSRENILTMMHTLKVRQIPLVDAEGIVVGVETIEELERGPATRDNWVVLMAGGLGTRLHPLTQSTPKPLLRVGNKPVLEIILESYIKHGFHRFYLAVNYKRKMVMEHFGDGSRWGCEIRYIEENQRMGTAGALGLIPDPPDTPLMVMNGDLLTSVNFESLLEYHQENGAEATIGVREYEFEVPYGVVNMDDHQVRGIDEKPVNKFFVNAGIYVLEPSVLALLPQGTYHDMTTLLTDLIAAERKVVAFPIREYWLDIGQPDDFVKANADFVNGLE